ncbi:MAG TPA: NAD(P)H-dependent oxidoreductase [Bryobacteraceae bacterium]|nr:NAD(P)H-dependent oxidoreductase [Bryobacteraceae bacterium]
MSRILHIDFSPRGERSHSRRLSKEFVDRWVTTNPGTKVVYRDAGRDVIPAIDESWISAAFTPEAKRTLAMKETLALSDELVDEVLAADVLVLGVPMYNFGVPAPMKAWIDQIIRVGRTFAVPEFRGLANGKKVFVLMSAGQAYEPGNTADFVVPFVRQVFGFIGITDVEVIRYVDHRDAAKSSQSLAAARERMDEVLQVAA